MKYGYDSKTKCLFSWQEDFIYQGKTDTIPSGAFVLEEENRLLYELAGCHFLSGIRDNCLFYYSNGSENKLAYGNILSGDFKWMDCSDLRESVSKIQPSVYFCIAGDIASDSQKIADICNMFPCNRIFVCSLVEGLAAFGVLVTNILDKEKPRRVSLCVPNKEVKGENMIGFDEKLFGDGYGQMAYMIFKGLPVFNMMMNCPCVSPFYGKVLAEKTGYPPTFIVRREAVDNLFPGISASVVYAATSVPVRIKNTSSFMSVSQFKEDVLDIVVASDFIPELPVFMNFYKIMSGKDFVGTTLPEQLVSKKDIPVFGYNGYWPTDYFKRD